MAVTLALASGCSTERGDGEHLGSDSEAATILCGGVICVSIDSCHNVTCVGSACVQLAKPNGASCNDGNACTSVDVCTAGVCAGRAYSCTPTACQVASVCNGSGACIITYSQSGASCDDGNACTYGDSCNGIGACTGRAIVCAGDPCTQRSCNGTSSCTVTLLVAGTGCNDGNACTYGDNCNGAGACSGTAITCAADACNARACNGTSTCTVVPKPGIACNDGNTCTYSDTCDVHGICAGLPVTCTTDACTLRNCNGTSACTTRANPGYTSCATGQLGVCSVGATTCVANGVCTARVQPSTELCDGLDNNCNGAVDEGNPGGGAACAAGGLGVCAAGTITCAGGALLCAQNIQPSVEICDGLDNNCDGLVDNIAPVLCSPGACGAGYQACAPSGSPTGTVDPTIPAAAGYVGVCRASALTAQGVVCRAAAGACDVAEVCTGTSATCPADSFMSAGVLCRGAFGACDVAESCTGAAATCPPDAQRPNGTACDDANLCTQSDACSAGTCVGSNVIACGGGTQCVPATGLCPVALGPTAVSTGGNFSCALTSGGVKCWGSANAGQLGNGNATGSSSTPVQVTGLTSGVTALSLGEGFACAVVNGGAECWGDNALGQLGRGTAGSAPANGTPASVVGLPAGSGVTGIATGQLFACAIVHGGVRCWGYNQAGALGIGSTQDSLTPVVATAAGGAPLAGVTSIAAGIQHVCALANGGLRCWGSNWNGCLGDGTGQEQDRAVDVLGLTSGVLDVSASFVTSCAVLLDGSLRCWGSNEHGMAGVPGYSGQLNSPQVVPSFGFATAVHNYRTYTCALVGTSEYCWGENGDGEVGNGTTNQSYLPTLVSPLGPVTALGNGYGYSSACAVAAGTVSCWGRGGDGQLGNGAFASSLVPVQVIGL